ncbi:MAG: XdhC family protein [Actinomycetia bacterium]|nr:XdhC family protein [Actinomycetes bacterium]MCP4223308.1 XdhC family protein [Actinomycetes bacterium]MCP5032000.1 XdhC family protein [Actinomycetes bacterium]
MSILIELLAAQEARTPVVLAIVVDTKHSVPRRAGSKMLVYGDGTISGTVGGGEMETRVVAEGLEAMVDRKPRRLTYPLVDPAAGDPGVCGGEVELYLEPHMPQTTIYVIGTGHVGQAVVELATWLGYRVVAWDDRPALAEAVEAAHTTMTGPIAEAIEIEPIDEHTMVIMATRNVQLDTELLPKLLATPTPYVGLMGSTRRWDTTRKRLLDAGISEADLDRVNAPIGIEIQAETPAEIAVSILAEVIGNGHGP